MAFAGGVDAELSVYPEQALSQIPDHEKLALQAYPFLLRIIGISFTIQGISEYDLYMKQVSQTILEWSYEPADFFEEGDRFSWSGGEVEITGGKVRGVFDASRYEQGREFRDQAHEAVLSRFKAQQVQLGRCFDLSLISFACEYEDGRRNETMFLETARFELRGGDVDFVLRDKTGNIVSDSKRERMDRQREFRDQVAKLLPNDKRLKSILQSYHNALSDEGNILIHLYEIREAIWIAYGRNMDAIKTLGISGLKWSRFGVLTNVAPMLEGRHRGKHTELRSMDAEDLAFAKSFAKSLIEAYVRNKSNSLAANLTES